MRTDGIFYDLFLKFPSVFFELMGGSARDAEDYDFTSVEVKELAFRIDGVFEPDEDSDLPIWFVEAQAQPKENLYERLFTEAFIYLRQQRPDRDWRAAVFYLSFSVLKRLEGKPRHRTGPRGCFSRADALCSALAFDELSTAFLTSLGIDAGCAPCCWHRPR